MLIPENHAYQKSKYLNIQTVMCYKNITVFFNIAVITNPLMKYKIITL